MASTWGFSPDQRKASFRTNSYALDIDSEQSRSLVGWWPMSDPINGTYHNRSMYPSHATKVSAGDIEQLVSNHPRWGGVRAAQFTGDELGAGSPPELVIYGAVTLVASANHDSFGNGKSSLLGEQLVNYGEDLDQTNNNVLYSMGVNATKDLTMFWEHGGGTNDGAQTAPMSINTGEWHYYSVSRAGTTNNDMTFFLDGDVIHEATDANAPDNSEAGTVCSIGALATNQYKHKGQILDVRIYNRELPRALVNQIHTHPEQLVRPLGVRKVFLPPTAPVGGRIMSSLAAGGGLAGVGGIAGEGGGLAG